jgi:hypothetical protein
LQTVPVGNLRAGFATEYIDPKNFATRTANELKRNMKVYLNEKLDYVAPYTSLITSSMMGKSRLMKEMARYIPIVYICARSADSNGYPPRTPAIIDWFQYKHSPPPSSSIIKEDRFAVIPTFKYTSFFLGIYECLSQLLRDPAINDEYNIKAQAKERNYSWMWSYFAEPSNHPALAAFWRGVIDNVKRRTSKFDNAAAALFYFRTNFGMELTTTYNTLIQSFEDVGYESPTLVLFFDEARCLCEVSAADGKLLPDTYSLFHKNVQPVVINEDPSGNIPFSTFRAIRRALRFLHSKDELKPNIFALFTDTSSTLTNFQPTTVDDRSMRSLKLPIIPPGEKQFPPICIFTSFDAYSRRDNQCGSIEDVADPQRLVNFGRAGWRALYDQENEASSILDIAKGKLLCCNFELEFSTLWKDRPIRQTFNRRNLLQLFAVLAPRLAITAGPYSCEASEMIASHMAVLLRTDKDRHFLRTAYPSEPILAEASAALTATNGWGMPLAALQHYIQSGIVDAGFKGELLTKIVCLMAMDQAHESLSIRNPWKYSSPLPVSRFLNHLIAIDHIKHKNPGFEPATFSQYVEEYSSINKENLRRFMNGQVFFTHFIRVETTISIAKLVRAWNRGAAIMCKAYNPRFDYIIPVMIDDTKVKDFGPLYGKWNKEQIEAAHFSISYILIDSKNYTLPPKWQTYVGQIKPVGNEEPILKQNLLDCMPYINVYASIIQDFGPQVDGEATFLVEPINLSDKVMKPRSDYQQLQIVLKGDDERTYECLKDHPNRVKGEMMDKDRYLVRKYFRQLREAKSDYLDIDDYNPDHELIRGGIADSLPLIFDYEDKEGDNEVNHQMQIDEMEFD